MGRYSAITKRKRDQLKGTIDEFCTFVWCNKDSWEDFGAFIIANERGDLRASSGPTFTNNYSKPQFETAAGQLQGVSFNTMQIKLSVGIYWSSMANYRKFLNWLHPYEINDLSFSYNLQYAYFCKLAKIDESSKYIIGYEDGEPMYYFETQITFDIQGEPCAHSVEPYKWSNSSNLEPIHITPATKNINIEIRTDGESFPVTVEPKSIQEGFIKHGIYQIEDSEPSELITNLNVAIKIPSNVIYKCGQKIRVTGEFDNWLSCNVASRTLSSPNLGEKIHTISINNRNYFDGSYLNWADVEDFAIKLSSSEYEVYLDSYENDKRVNKIIWVNNTLTLQFVYENSDGEDLIIDSYNLETLPVNVRLITIKYNTLTAQGQWMYWGDKMTGDFLSYSNTDGEWLATGEGENIGLFNESDCYKLLIDYCFKYAEVSYLDPVTKEYNFDNNIKFVLPFNDVKTNDFYINGCKYNKIKVNKLNDVCTIYVACDEGGYTQAFNGNYWNSGYNKWGFSGDDIHAIDSTGIGEVIYTITSLRNIQVSGDIQSINADINFLDQPEELFHIDFKENLHFAEGEQILLNYDSKSGLLYWGNDGLLIPVNFLLRYNNKKIIKNFNANKISLPGSLIKENLNYEELQLKFNYVLQDDVVFTLNNNPVYTINFEKNKETYSDYAINWAEATIGNINLIEKANAKINKDNLSDYLDIATITMYSKQSIL